VTSDEIRAGEKQLQSHKDLNVWKKSMEFVQNIYRITREFPKEEQYGLSAQMRRSAISIPSNIAEGAARNSKKEFKQFLYISLGSAAEIETQLEIAEGLGYISNGKSLQTNIMEIRKMLMGLISFVAKKKNSVKV
jgi:four helix bundle protein